MNRKELWEIFMLFLDMNDCKGSYLYYLRRDGFKVKQARDERSPRYGWTDNYWWGNTRQGNDFWNSIYIKWEAVVDKLDIGED